ncbi:MAG: DNA methyltransferase [Thaumarchaeota archaeon]|nr:DNA methyltransferase [Nitrososphaerota archaeon]
MLQKFLAISAYGKLSLLELASLVDAGIFDFEITNCTSSSVLLEMEEKLAKGFASRVGGMYKLVRICGESPDDLFGVLPLPDIAKFNWTISSYGCTLDDLDDTVFQVRQFLKSNSLGKARFLEPEAGFETDSREGTNREVKISELARNVLSENDARVKGLDVVIHCDFGKKLYGYTEFTSDVLGYERRDFTRSYQDPTTTLGPRIARVLVNLTGLRKGETLLDPFCGLGTILQEALMCSLNSVGIDISEANVRKCKSNLEWFKKDFRISEKLRSQIVRGDSTRLNASYLPKVHGIATEPLLLPKFESNPTASEAEEVLLQVKMEYADSIRAFSRLLQTEQKAALVAPEIVDDRGRVHTIKVEDLLLNDFSLYNPKLPRVEVENPSRVPTSKRKIVQRKVYVMQKL